MGLLLTAGASFHWVKHLSAEHITKGALKIIVHGDPGASEEQFNNAEILFFMDDTALCDRLVAAINSANPARVITSEEIAASEP